MSDSRFVFGRKTLVLCALCLLVTLCVFSTQKAFASEVSQKAVFDLTTMTKQEQQVTLEDGTVGTLGVQPTISPIRPLSSLGNGYGSWKIYWYTGVLNTSYMIDVKNYCINKCYDNYANGIGVVVDHSELNWDSKWSSQTTRYHEDFFTTFDTRILTGKIQGTELVTYVN